MCRLRDGDVKRLRYIPIGVSSIGNDKVRAATTFEKHAERACTHAQCRTGYPMGPLGILYARDYYPWELRSAG